MRLSEKYLFSEERSVFTRQIHFTMRCGCSRAFWELGPLLGAVCYNLECMRPTTVPTNSLRIWRYIIIYIRFSEHLQTILDKINGTVKNGWIFKNCVYGTSKEKEEKRKLFGKRILLRCAVRGTVGYSSSYVQPRTSKYRTTYRKIMYFMIFCFFLIT